MEDRAYHPGSRARALIDAALGVVEQGGPEAYVPLSRERRDAQRPNDVAITREFNITMGHAPGGPV